MPRITLRARLTLWYLLTLAAILLLFLTFLYWQMQRSLLNQLDAGLALAASQAVVGVDTAVRPLSFQNQTTAAGDGRLDDDFVVYLMAPDGAILDRQGRDEFPPQLPRPGAATVSHEDDHWRVYNALVGDAGWVQVAQEMDVVEDTLDNIVAQSLVGLPLALILAGFGGSFLAWRALRPIDDMTQTARAINAGDLSRRIDYSGPPDEVGRLAETFDAMLDRLQAAFARERRFTGDAAHELRTPLTALKGRIEVTLSQQRERESYVATLEEMGGQVDRLIRLSNDLLFIARLDQGQQTIEREPVALDSFLAAVVEQVRPLARQKAVSLTLDTPPETAASTGGRGRHSGQYVLGDLDLLIRLFLNLLDNAIKFTPAGGRVSVEVETEGETVPSTSDRGRHSGQAVIAVSDTGPGIAAEHQPHLFERFFRVEGDRARGRRDDQPGGAGLGLAIVYEIVRAHEGKITVESRPGEGTTFRVWLPMRRE